MTDTLRHRGPDDSGVCVADGIGLGHRRLSIIDLSTRGYQPMLSRDGSCVLIYNGEIYDYPGLRCDLEDRGHSFAGYSDTETLLNAYLEWGVEAFPRLEGMSAFALWDS